MEFPADQLTSKMSMVSRTSLFASMLMNGTPFMTSIERSVVQSDRLSVFSVQFSVSSLVFSYINAVITAIKLELVAVITATFINKP